MNSLRDTISNKVQERVSCAQVSLQALCYGLSSRGPELNHSILTGPIGVYAGRSRSDIVTPQIGYSNVEGRIRAQGSAPGERYGFDGEREVPVHRLQLFEFREWWLGACTNYTY